MQEKAKIRGKRVDLILTGGNIDFDLFQKWIASNENAATAATALA